MPLIDGLISSWRFNGDWTDQVGSNHGTPSGALIDTGNKKLGSGSSLYDGFNDLANFGNDSSFNVANFSISFWVYITVDITGVLINKRGGGNSFYILFNGASTGRITMGVWTPTGHKANHSGNAVALDTWEHVVVSHDGTNMRIYINEVLKKKTAHAGDMATCTGDMIAGAYFAGSSWYTGNLDQIDFWGRALTYDNDIVGVVAGGEISEMYNDGEGREIGGAALTRQGIGRGLNRGLGRGL